jgi:hypothetical protein
MGIKAMSCDIKPHCPQPGGRDRENELQDEAYTGFKSIWQPRRGFFWKFSVSIDY